MFWLILGIGIGILLYIATVIIKYEIEENKKAPMYPQDVNYFGE